MRDRDARLALFGPPGFLALFNQVVRPIIGPTRYPARRRRARGPRRSVGYDVVRDRGSRSSTACRVRLRVRRGRPAGPLRRGARAQTLGVAPGPDFGRLQRGEAVNGVAPEQVMGEGRPRPPARLLRRHRMPRRATEVYAALRRRARARRRPSAEDEKTRARETGHHGASQAAQLAVDAKVKLLALTHLSTRYFPRDIRERPAPRSRTRSSARLRHDRDPVPGAGASRPAGSVRRRKRHRPGALLGSPRSFNPVPGGQEGTVSGTESRPRRGRHAATLVASRTRSSRRTTVSRVAARRHPPARRVPRHTAPPRSSASCWSRSRAARRHRHRLLPRRRREPAASAPLVHASNLDFRLDGLTIVIVDDVLYTGPHRARRDRRDLRLRAPRPGPARRAGRPRPPRAADPPRLRRQEPADGARGARQRPRRARSTASTR